MPLRLAFILAMRSKASLSTELDTTGLSFAPFNNASQFDSSSPVVRDCGARTGFAKRKTQTYLDRESILRNTSYSN